MSSEATKSIVPKRRYGGPAYWRLKERHKRFVDYYLSGMTAGQAVEQIGARYKNPGGAGFRLLSHPVIREAINERRGFLLADIGLRQERVLAEMLALATSDVRRLFDTDGKLLPAHQLDEQTARAISSVEVEDIFEGSGEERERVGYRYKYKFWDKGKALDKLGQYFQTWQSASVNVDARSVHVHKNDAADTPAVRALVELGERLAGLGTGQSDPQAGADGSLLPAEVHPQPGGRRAPVVIGADSGGSE